MWHFLFALQLVVWFFLNLFGKGVMIIFYLICLTGKIVENPLGPKGTKRASVETEACFFNKKIPPPWQEEGERKRAMRRGLPGMKGDFHSFDFCLTFGAAGDVSAGFRCE